MGVEILGGRTSVCPTSPEGAITAREMLPWEILKSRASLMPFPAFWGEILHGASEK